MIETLRGLGYTTASALADIIDNSISANATSVHLTFRWHGPGSTITILDDGKGMDDQELEHAMRLGDRNPLDKRAPGDLGRFGIGLKTASFSQCRRLTVASLKNGMQSCLRWDLDVLAASKHGDWHLLDGPAPGSEHELDPLHTTGTLVVWEALDRIVTNGTREQDFLDVIDTIERHLAMVYHRYLDGAAPRLTLTINGRAVKPWDPFLTDHSATWSSPIERLHTDHGVVGVQCYVLPHKDRLTTAEHTQAGGPDGWTAQQGFYVYRNERLLVAGNWLGLGTGKPWTKEEVHRLARIRLDLPNTADADWKIDIRKATARPPVTLKNRLTRLADDTRARARRVFAHRGNIVPTTGNQPLATAWRAVYHHDGMQYRIDTEHAAIKIVLDDAGPLAPQVRAMLRIIEETIPVQRIWLDTVEQKETPRTGFANADKDDVLGVLRVLYSNLVKKKGLAPNLAREQLLHTDPFHQHADLIQTLPDDLEQT